MAPDEPADDFLRRLRYDRGTLEDALSDPSLWDRLSARKAYGDPLLVASPFLVFAVMVQRALLELARAPYIEEPFGPRRRIPVFDVASLLSFLEDPERRLFLTELMVSYTHVASGSIVVRSPKGWRRHRFSELDPVRMAALLEVLPEAERPGVYRRLGDLSLFLTGIFPDRSISWPLGSVSRQRLLRSAGEPGAGDSTVEWVEPEHEALGMLSLLEALGERWYRLAFETASPPLTARLRLIGGIADRFTDARRVLNFITDRYLFPHRVRWFPDSPN